MSGYRRIRFHNPPAWAGTYQPRKVVRSGLGDWADDELSSYADSGSTYGADNNTLSELVVYASPPAVDVTPYEPILSPPIELFQWPNFLDPGSFNTTPPTVDVPPAATSNPVKDFIQHLLPKPGKPSPKGPAAPGGASSSISIKPPAATPKPKPAAGGLMPTPEIAAGLALAGLVFAAALLAGHHDRRAAPGGARGRARR